MSRSRWSMVPDRCRRAPGAVKGRRLLPWALLGALAAGCGGEGGVSPQALRFGQSGEIRAQVITPLAGGAGELRQLLTWSSDGSWQLFESIAYRGLVGDETLRRGPGDAGAYAALISLVNENPDLSLFGGEADPSLDPSCDPTRARVILTIRDDLRREERSWTRCARGPLRLLTPEGAGPDPGASRVVQAVTIMRGSTVAAAGPFVSAYHGSVPFGTLDRGTESGAALSEPRVIVAGEDGGEAAASEWRDFWARHTGRPGAEPPEVDWGREMVVLAFVGERHEAGDSVEVRRILSVAGGTLVELFERVPGDFCAPRAVTQLPFHVVVAPRTPPAIRFGSLRVERVPCGL